MGDIKDLFENVDNVQLKLAFEFIQYTNKNIFLTGKAGTGKTTFLKSLKENLPKRMIVVAPTGVAAINAGGVTIHSFFQLPFGPQIPLDNENKSENAFKRNNYKFNITKIDIIKSLDLLVIDEISMVRADLLDGIDEVLRRYKEKDKFFGGVQLLMIGDLQQLSPVVRDSEWEILKSYYDNMYFFSSRALKSTQCICVELKHIYRQKDDYFIDLLNKVRNNELSADTLNKINKRFEEKFTKDVPEGYIILTTHNSKAQKINGFKLKQLKTDEFIFEAEIEGNFPENSYPIEYTLSFKKGAQVMFVKNDTSAEKLFYNGKIGKIENIKDNIIYVKCENENDYIEVTPVEWENIKYTINNENKEIESKVEGRFTQFPLRLAWSITIHKSQGLTFEKAIIDAKNAFSHGQVYVALSRCKTLEGLFLNSKISSECIINDKIVTDFTNKIGLDTPDRLLLEKSKYEYQKILLLDLFEFSNIARLFGYCLKIYRENKGSLQQSFYDVADKILNLINNDLIIVSKKFETQIEKILEFDQDIENNKKLNERIKKACAYFREKIENNILKSLKDINLESDNKSIVKIINKLIIKIESSLNIKLKCLESCELGFSVKEYLNIKAKASIEKTSKRETKEKKNPISIDSIKYPILFSSLKKWRDEEAEKINKPKYMVIQVNALITISSLIPQSKEQLLKVNGIGNKKMELYGEEILEIVNDYCNNNLTKEERLVNVKSEPINIKNVLKNTKAIKSTINETLELFKKGISINNIAKERGLTVRTIENHLAKCISENMLDIFEVIDEKKFNTIKDEFKKLGYEYLKPIKEKLGDEYSYSDLQYVQYYLKKYEK